MSHRRRAAMTTSEGKHCLHRATGGCPSDGGASRGSAGRLVAPLEALAGSLLLAAALAAPALLDGLAPSSGFARALAGDGALRAWLAAGGAALLALAWAARRSGPWGAPWVRAALGSAVLFASALVGASRADRWIAPRALVEHPAVVSAPAVMLISKTLMSYLRASTQRPGSELGVPNFRELVPLLERERAFVGMVWRDELDHVGAPGRVEELATGRMYGRELVLIRAARRPPRAS